MIQLNRVRWYFILSLLLINRTPGCTAVHCNNWVLFVSQAQPWKLRSLGVGRGGTGQGLGTARWMPQTPDMGVRQTAEVRYCGFHNITVQVEPDTKDMLIATELHVWEELPQYSEVFHFWIKPQNKAAHMNQSSVQQKMHLWIRGCGILLGYAGGSSLLMLQWLIKMRSNCY